ncbi:putative ABC exporter domain-containing protein [Anaerosacchariphilus polymeriproducens]|uniref:ABC exporter n=1 Tax=Anaerosacchariphilus polymeriproducens TaxID=1812858 RepID=A0A371AUM9_9FIRM|nr:putative ABC exporter domain-containing protein [Anaerosacchariphilus polymeriproducens]RDU23276.1 hypothetical protein DWV06_10225 [Anaerosacchariphilus polymeriproducens]
MNGFVYLYKTTLKNRTIKALKKPVTYVYLIFIGWYLFSMVFGMGSLLKSLHFDEPEGFAAALTILMFAIIPANMISYTKRKGLLFRPSEVQFVFTAPVTPKQVLLFAQVKSIALGILLGIWLVFLGSIYCHIPLWRMLLYFLFSVMIENVLEASIMISLYGNETISEKIIKKLPILLYGIMIIFVLAGFYVVSLNGFSISSVQKFLSIPWIQCVPLIGWCIAIIRLIIIGPTVLNIVCTVLYCLTTILLTLYAYKMKCNGEYYEDAMKFADDYQDIMNKKKRGEVGRLGKKKKFNNATINYKGNFAKAIFYRQLLEYKKNKFFIFGGNTLVALAAGIGIAVFAHYNPEMIKVKEFVILGVAAYIMIIFSGYATRWSKELENPYTFLIPDNPFRKVWYATMIEHIRAFVDGLLITIPAAIYLKISFINTILIIIIIMCLKANKLYTEMLSEFLVGQTLGAFGKSLIKLLMQSIVIGLAVLAAVLTGIAMGLKIAFFVLLVVMLGLTLAIAMGAVVLFDKMETVN